ncbi:WD40_repeat protein [Hexamita inflata]|uniref:WD40 repeat protein n=1 Tax=Hexamita inflata TaxID=28002 RepID=A0AA86QCU9_9EUKA|nr:WD40 repeat protein [Hexamita inflata]
MNPLNIEYRFIIIVYISQNYQGTSPEQFSSKSFKMRTNSFFTCWQPPSFITGTPKNDPQPISHDTQLHILHILSFTIFYSLTYSTVQYSLKWHLQTTGNGYVKQNIQQVQYKQQYIIKQVSQLYRKYILQFFCPITVINCRGKLVVLAMQFKDILYGKQADELMQSQEEEQSKNLITYFSQENESQSQVKTTNLSAATLYLKSQPNPHPHLFKLVAEAALKELALDLASQNFVRARDYVSYHFAEHIRRIGSDELRRAEVSIFLGDFKTAEDILIKQLGRPDLSVRNDEQLGCWFKIIQAHKDNEFQSSQTVQISDELATFAYRQAGLYYLRQRDYVQAVTMLQSSKDIFLLTEAYYRAEMYDELRQLATTLQADINYDAIINVSKVLARIGDVEGATLALLRLNKQEDAIKTCITLKRFDKAIMIAQEFNMLDVVDKHLSEYLKQLLSSGDDKAALDLLRKTNQGEIAACIIIGAAMEELKEALEQRTFPIKQGVFNRLRRLVVLAAKEATEVQRRNVSKELKNQVGGSALLTTGTTDKTLDNLVNDTQPTEKQDIMDNQLFQRFGNKVKSVPMIWKIVKQTRYIVLASYMLYMGKPEQSLFPALEASGFYQKLIQNVGNIQNVVDEEYRSLQKVALPIAILAALQIKDFELASQLLEVLESDETLPSIERDQLEQLAVDIFSKFPPVESHGVNKETQLQCDKCKTMLPKYCVLCTCGWQANLCSRTGMPINPKHKIQKCNMCGCIATQGKNYLSVCPMCHESFD